MMVVTYLSDFSKEYTIGLRQCHDLERLREFGLHWGGLCSDAYAIIRAMTEKDFSLFRYGLAKESKDKYAGDVWAAQFGAILMPEMLLRVSLIAEHYGAPWGTAFLQCEKAGLIQRRGDVYVWVQPEKVSP